MDTRSRWSRILVIGGAIAMVIGVLDPLEGSIVILTGAGLVTLGTVLGRSAPRVLARWIAVVILIATGVAALFILSALGGIGGASGHSMWWGLLILPYPVGWLVGIVSLGRTLGKDPHHHVAT